MSQPSPEQSQGVEHQPRRDDVVVPMSRLEALRAERQQEALEITEIEEWVQSNGDAYPGFEAPLVIPDEPSLLGEIHGRQFDEQPDTQEAWEAWLDAHGLRHSRVIEPADLALLVDYKQTLGKDQAYYASSRDLQRVTAQLVVRLSAEEERFELGLEQLLRILGATDRARLDRPIHTPETHEILQQKLEVIQRWEREPILMRQVLEHLAEQCLADTMSARPLQRFASYTVRVVQPIGRLNATEIAL